MDTTEIREAESDPTELHVSHEAPFTPEVNPDQSASKPEAKPAKRYCPLFVDPETHRQFKTACASKGWTMNRRLKDLMLSDVASVAQQTA